VRARREKVAELYRQRRVGPRRFPMVEIHESRRDGMGKATYRTETSLERENPSVKNQTATRTAEETHRTNDHRSLEKRLGAWDRWWAADTGIGISGSDLSSGSSNVTPGLRLLPVPRSWKSVSSWFLHSWAASKGSLNGGKSPEVAELRTDSSGVVKETIVPSNASMEAVDMVRCLFESSFHGWNPLGCAPPPLAS